MANDSQQPEEKTTLKTGTPFDALIPEQLPGVEDIFGTTDVDPTPESTRAQTVAGPQASKIPAPPQGITPNANTLQQSDIGDMPLYSVQNPLPAAPVAKNPQPMGPAPTNMPPTTPPLNQGGDGSGFGMSRTMVYRIVGVVVVAIIIIVIAVMLFMYPEVFRRVDGVDEAVDTSNPAIENQNTAVTPTDPAVRPARGMDDQDGDGLLDTEEAQRKTDPKKADSDEDGLSDRQEVQIYKTNPLGKDTDKDGFDDGAEVRGLYNPNGDGPLLNVSDEIQKQQTQ